MFESRSIHDLAFVSRQLSHLLQDHELEPALAKLSEAVPADYADDVERLRAVLSSSTPASPAPGAQPYQTMTELLPYVGAQRGAFFRQFIDYVEQSRATFQTYWAGMTGLLVYLLAISAVALIVTFNYSRYVLPGFVNMFESFGKQLPSLTESVFSFSGPGIVSLVALLVLMLVLLIVFAVVFRRRVRQLAPMPDGPIFMLLLGRFARLYNAGLFMNFARMLRASDVDPVRAVSGAARLSNQHDDLSFDALRSTPRFDSDKQLGELAIAARVDNFDRELEHQCEQHIGDLVSALVRMRNRISIVLKLVLFLLIGTLVVAMYLPIFRLGTVL